jgi:hypothetical protein
VFFSLLAGQWTAEHQRLLNLQQLVQQYSLAHITELFGPAAVLRSGRLPGRFECGPGADYLFLTFVAAYAEAHIVRTFCGCSPAHVLVFYRK